MFLFARSLTRDAVEPRTAGSTTSGVKFAKYVRYLCVLFLFANFLFLGCDGNNDRLVSLDGTWVSTYSEVFIIDLVNKTYNNPANGQWGDYSVAGNISEIAYFTSGRNIGIIYVQITSKGNEFETDGTGSFTGVHFKYLDNTTVSFSTAMNTSYKTPVYSTLADAKQALNENMLGTYFGTGSACTKN